MPKRPTPAFDINKFEHPHQCGGIQTGSLDHPQPNGGQACRVAFVNTGAGLTFTVALDRGGDIVEAQYLGKSLAFLTPNGYKPPSHAYHRGVEWLASWPGGLLTTCGPLHIGAPRDAGVADRQNSLHGHFSNTPAATESVTNPDPRRKRLEMRLDLLIRCTTMFGPSVEVRRSIVCTLGRPTIELHDRVTNISDFAVPHHWLYHVNLGYPLLDEGAKLVYGGDYDWHWPPEAIPGELVPSPQTFAKYKTIPAPMQAHAQDGQRGVIVVPKATRGVVTVGVVNRKADLGFALSYPARQLPRLANWQNFGPRGCYVTGLEPFNGSLRWDGNDKHPGAKQTLRPGQTAEYDLTIRALSGKQALDGLVKHDAPLTGA